MSRKNPFVMPILKWVGGKRQLLDSINPLIPECSTYYEPFIGGGAVLFGRQPNKAGINDSNEELINVYRMIKEEPEALIAALSAHKEQNCEEYYYTVRAWDRDKETYQTRFLDLADLVGGDVKPPMFLNFPLNSVFIK